MQVRLGDTVYVLRALKPEEQEKKPEATENQSETDKSFLMGGIKHTMMSPNKGSSQAASNLTKNNYPSYKSVTNPKNENMDIFFVERLWINNQITSHFDFLEKLYLSNKVIGIGKLSYMN